MERASDPSDIAKHTKFFENEVDELIAETEINILGIEESMAKVEEMLR
jgi:hypothetical protein